jgi:glycine/D-amino acid oxidase-like deaminating enzyme
VIDCLIIGGGIAGINVAWQLEQRGINYRLVDPFTFTSSTSISAGLINPVTGRKFATQWNMDVLIPIITATYRELELFTKTPFFFEHTLFKIHKNEAVLEEWLKMKSSKPISKYIFEHPNSTKYGRYLDFRHGAVGVKPAFRLLTKALQRGFLNAVNDKIIQANFDYQTLQINKDTFIYNNEHYRHLIFCEGVAATQNPWWQFIQFKPAKGECLIIEVPNMDLDEIITKGIILVPLGNCQYWVGATNTWDEFTSTPTAAGKEELTAGLNNLLKLPYSILSHEAAVRPSIKDRTPVVGRHPEIDRMYILNGLGTKGASLSPYYAQQLISHIYNQTPINTEVAVNRF